MNTPFPHRNFQAALVAFFLFMASHFGQAELFYGIVGVADTNGNPTSPVLCNLNSATPGTINTLGTISGISAGQTLEGIALAPNGTLYALGYVETAGASQGQAQHYTINLANGAATAVNATGVNIDFSQGGASAISSGLAFVSATAIQVIDGGGNFFQLNATTGNIVAGNLSTASRADLAVALNAFRQIFSAGNTLDASEMA